MAKSKEQKTAAKTTKSSGPKASQVRSKTSLLSSENVVDSDSESSGGDPDTESEDEKRQNKKQPNPQNVKATEPTEPPVPSDNSKDDTEDDSDDTSSEEEDSDTSSDDASEDPKELPQDPLQATTKQNSAKRKANAVDENGQANGESSQDNGHKSKKVRISDVHESSQNSKGIATIDSSQTSGVNFQSSAEEEGGTGQKSASRKPREKSKVSSLEAIPVQKFTPPPGYEAISPNGSALLSASDLQGKQIWHLTAPIDVPISNISSVALDAIQSRSTVLTHKGIDYILSEDQPANVTVILPDKDGYTPFPQRVSRTLNLCQKLDLPQIPSAPVLRDAGSEKAANVATAAVEAIRPQPEGLRMRFKPTGFGDGDAGIIGGTSSDEEPDQPRRDAFQFPRSIGPHPDGDRVGDVNTVTKKKKKKDKHRPGSSSGMPNGVTDHAMPDSREDTSAVPNPIPGSAESLSQTGSQSKKEKKKKKKKSQEEDQL